MRAIFVWSAIILCSLKPSLPHNIFSFLSIYHKIVGLIFFLSLAITICLFFYFMPETEEAIRFWGTLFFEALWVELPQIV